MYDDSSVGVVVPAYNEEPFIEAVLTTIPEFVDRTFVVDDCSTDGTWEIVSSLADRTAAQRVTDGGTVEPDQAATTLASAIPDQDIVPVRHESNGGRGAAVKTGYELALVDGHDIVAVMDGDGQMDPTQLERIVEPVAAGRVEYAKGNRLASPDHWAGMSRWRLFGNTVLTALTKVASGYWGMRDPQNGYTAISADALRQLDLDSIYDDYGFLNDLLIRLDARGMRLADVPITAVYGDESSGIEYSTFVPRLSWLLLTGFLWRLWTKYFRRATASRDDSTNSP
ncbi:glycosyltransferase family 2 protein [Haloarcula pelagica]|uniref:glycosyltransferase family 2 protein n=1 Tax=Haloarcula pelagica TaxID=3033389 RepID=UPI0024C3871C|nr:glycosyltransferase family 2 protein [Halomicroarcula sp. YJ-61-S]